MRVISGASLVLCGLLLLLLVPRTLGLAPQPRGERAYVRWGMMEERPLASILGNWVLRWAEIKWDPR